MATQTQVQVIDADAHVVETERTWDYLEPSEQKYRPLLYASPHDSVSQYWLIDNQVRGLRFPYGQEIWTHPFTNSYVLTIHCSLACLPPCYRPYSLSI
jgi:hypothetical protein